MVGVADPARPTHHHSSSTSRRVPTTLRTSQPTAYDRRRDPAESAAADVPGLAPRGLRTMRLTLVALSLVVLVLGRRRDGVGRRGLLIRDVECVQRARTSVLQREQRNPRGGYGQRDCQ